MSVIVDLAVAVTELINSGAAPLDYPVAVTAERVWVPLRSLDELAEMAHSVLVAPRDSTNERGSRSGFLYDCRVDIGVQKKLEKDPANEIAQCDAMNELVEAIETRLRDNGVPGASFVSIERPVDILREHLLQHGVFTALLTATYRVER